MRNAQDTASVEGTSSTRSTLKEQQVARGLSTEPVAPAGPGKGSGWLGWKAEGTWGSIWG